MQMFFAISCCSLQFFPTFLFLSGLFFCVGKKFVPLSHLMHLAKVNFSEAKSGKENFSGVEKLVLHSVVFLICNNKIHAKISGFIKQCIHC